MKAVAAKVGLDGHYRGIKFVARVLRDAGLEVVYLGLHSSPEQVVRVTIDEDARLIALSFLSADYRAHVPRICALLREAGASDVHVILGGLIDPADHEMLKQAGVSAIFGPETRAQEIMARVRSLEIAGDESTV